MEVSTPESMKLWERGRKLGAGGYGFVCLAHPLAGHPLFLPDSSLQIVMAVKSAKYTSSSSLIRERNLFKKFKDCPHIIRYLGCDCTYEEDERFRNIFMQYAAGGSLHDRIKSAASRGTRISEIEAREVTECVLHGLRFIHSKGYVHCDIKTDNILIVKGKAKIGDLGLTIKPGKYPGKIIGTRNYMAPESFKSGDYTSKADIWGLGCCLFEMITGVKIWRHMKEDEIHKIIERSRMSDKAQLFWRKCMVEDPEQRWDAELLLQHPFIVDHPPSPLSTGKQVCKIMPTSSTTVCQYKAEEA
ncbi:mitogen-activated protein kinase kinase kinase 20-like [Impatiens glandulifera]|uniref:mitogen-activated protein kinase kinase kinase 20-like n=1 Tax=Impatiens glandulifera TaxID=253017 RepID=UPI001FB097CB|nr:mitogen-activated protein kinase kinase kinase 20-like [Impatiens glandulifera]